MSFRKFGGLNYNAKNNFVNNNISISNKLNITDGIGQNNSVINFYSDINTPGNIISGGTISANEFITTSDVTLKKNIENLTSDYCIDNLRPVSYNMISNDKFKIGFIGQEMEEIYPSFVSQNIDGKKAIDYNNFIGILIKEVQDLKKEVAYLKTKIT